MNICMLTSCVSLSYQTGGVTASECEWESTPVRWALYSLDIPYARKSAVLVKAYAHKGAVLVRHYDQ